MIITRAMPTQQTAIIGVSRRITAGQEFKAGLCRAPAHHPARGWHSRPQSQAPTLQPRTAGSEPQGHAPLSQP